METNLHSNIVLYSKGHYPQVHTRFEDVQIILGQTFPSEAITPEKTIQVLAALAYKAIIANKDPLREFINTVLFVYNARKSVADQLSNLEECIEELLAQTLLARLAGTVYSNLGEVDEKIIAALYS